MPDISKDIILLLQYLLPGFLVAWVYYGLTSHVKPSQFERVVQALIFAMLVKVLMIVEQTALLYLGRYISCGTWTENSDLFASLVSAVVLGFIIAALSNSDLVHEKLRDWKISKRSGNPSEWYGALNLYPRFVVLHLKDDRRLFGWPEMWPSDAEKGHFFMTHMIWQQEDGTEIEMTAVKGMLVNASDVKWVEFSKKTGD